MQELKPCPFCGYEVSLFEVNKDNEKAYIQCDECGLSVHQKWTSAETLIKEWNTRAERTCVPTAKPNVWGFNNFYCECGNKLLEVANGLGECLPNYCKNCGAKVVDSLPEAIFKRTLLGNFEEE